MVQASKISGICKRVLHRVAVAWCGAALVLLPGHPAAARPFPAVFGNGRGLSIAALANTRSVDQSGALAYVVNPVRHASALYPKLRNVRFGLVRQVVTPLPLMQPDPAARDAAIGQVVTVVDQIRAHGLAVVVDLHFWSPGTETAETMLADPAKQESFARGATALARALAGRKGVALELLNEPPPCPAGKAVDWQVVQRQLVARVRAVAPTLPLVLTGCGGQLDGLLELDVKPYTGDRNIRYTFHFYEPFIFTHQQTYLGGARLRSVPFPPPGRDVPARIVDAMAPAATRGTHRSTMAELNSYLSGHDSAPQIAARIDRAAVWARRHRIAPCHILLGEFGSTLGANGDAEAVRKDELRWLALVRNGAERAGFAWAYWSLPSSNSFDYDPTNHFIRSDVLDALDARLPRAQTHSEAERQVGG